MTDPSNSVLLAVPGELDVVRAAELLRDAEELLLANPGAQVLVLDLARTAFIDSTGLGSLIEIRTMAAELGASLRLRNVSASITGLLSMTGLTRAFEVD